MITMGGGGNVTLVKLIYLSLIRNKWRTVLLVVLVGVLSSVFVSALYIQKGYQLTVETVKARLPLTAKIIANQEGWEKRYKETGEWSSGLSFSEQQKIGELPQVAHFDIFRSQEIQSKLIKKVRSAEELTLDEEQSEEGADEAFINHFRLKSVMEELPQDERNGLIKLVRGQGWIEDEQNATYTKGVLVSEGVAKENGWQVGSTFDLDIIVSQSDEKETFGIQMPLEVKGIYQVMREYPEINSERSFEENVAIATLENTFYMTTKTSIRIDEEIADAHIQLGEASDLTEEKRVEQRNFGYDTTYYLKSQESLKSFHQDATALLDTELYAIKLGTDQFDALNPSLAKMNQIAKGIKWFGSLAVASILALLVFLILRDRQKELGMFLSLGRSKDWLLLQVGGEFLMIGILGSITVLFFGKWLANKLAVALRKEPDAFQMLGGQERQEQLEFIQMGGVEAQVDGSRLFELSYRWFDQVGIFLAVLAIIAIGVFLGMSYLLKLRPSILLRQG